MRPFQPCALVLIIFRHHQDGRREIHYDPTTPQVYHELLLIYKMNDLLTNEFSSCWHQSHLLLRCEGQGCQRTPTTCASCEATGLRESDAAAESPKVPSAGAASAASENSNRGGAHLLSGGAALIRAVPQSHNKNWSVSASKLFRSRPSGFGL